MDVEKEIIYFALPGTNRKPCAMRQDTRTWLHVQLEGFHCSIEAFPTSQGQFNGGCKKGVPKMMVFLSSHQNEVPMGVNEQTVFSYVPRFMINPNCSFLLGSTGQYWQGLVLKNPMIPPKKPGNLLIYCKAPPSLLQLIRSCFSFQRRSSREL